MSKCTSSPTRADVCNRWVAEGFGGGGGSTRCSLRRRWCLSRLVGNQSARELVSAQQHHDLVTVNDIPVTFLQHSFWIMWRMCCSDNQSCPIGQCVHILTTCILSMVPKQMQYYNSNIIWIAEQWCNTKQSKLSLMDLKLCLDAQSDLFVVGITHILERYI